MSRGWGWGEGEADSLLSRELHTRLHMELDPRALRS